MPLYFTRRIQMNIIDSHIYRIYCRELSECCVLLSSYLPTTTTWCIPLGSKHKILKQDQVDQATLTQNYVGSDTIQYLARFLSMLLCYNDFLWRGVQQEMI